MIFDYIVRGVHAPCFVVFGGDDLNAFRDHLAAVVMWLSERSRGSEVQDKEVRVSLGVVSMLAEPLHDGSMLFRMLIPDFLRRHLSVVPFGLRIHRPPIVIKVHLVQKKITSVKSVSVVHQVLKYSLIDSFTPLRRRPLLPFRRENAPGIIGD